MTTFRVDLLHPGGFARTWRDELLTAAVGKKLIYGYLGAFLAYFVASAIVNRNDSAVATETKAIAELKPKIAQREKDLANQRSMFKGITEIGTADVIWSEVLVALSEAMPRDVWLRSLELVDGAQLFRMVLVTPMRPGTGNLMEFERFFNSLAEDARFKKFQLQDWEVVSKEESGGKDERNITTTVTFKIVL